MFALRTMTAGLAFVAASSFPAFGQEVAESQFHVVKLGDRAILVTDGGMASQFAVRSAKGLVVFDPGWCPRIARAMRTRIEQEFGCSEVAAVVLTHQRLDIAGGNGAYEGCEIIAHERVRDVLARQKENLPVHLRPLIDMWRWKESVSRERLAGHPAGSSEAVREENWMNVCKQMADDLAFDCELILPTETFEERYSLDLGDMVLELEYFGGGSRGEAGIVARIPQLGLVLFGKLLFHEQHLLPYLNAEPWHDLEIPRALTVLDEIIADEKDIETVIVSFGPWPLEEIKARRRYMGDLWREVQEAVKQGASFAQVQQELTIDQRFPYLKEWEIWKQQGPEWVTEEHVANVARFWGQLQDFGAREVVRICRALGPGPALDRYAELADGQPDGPFVDADSFDDLAEILFREGFVAAAEAVTLRNGELFPDAWPVHLRLGEMHLARGNRAAARTAFRRVLELDPGNSEARQKIDELS